MHTVVRIAKKISWPMSKKDYEKTVWNATNMPGYKIIAQFIDDLVESCGIEINTLAERAGLTRQTIYDVRKGLTNPSIDKIERIMRACGTSLAEWLDEKSFYGRDKRFHDRIQLIINRKGIDATTIRKMARALLPPTPEDEET